MQNYTSDSYDSLEKRKEVTLKKGKRYENSEMTSIMFNRNSQKQSYRSKFDIENRWHLILSSLLGCGQCESVSGSILTW